MPFCEAPLYGTVVSAKLTTGRESGIVGLILKINYGAQECPTVVSKEAPSFGLSQGKCWHGT
jgi:hypothetical protein